MWNKQIQTWEDFDRERKRKVEKILEIERKLDKARNNLGKWSMQVVNHLIATIGERKWKEGGI